MIQILSMVPDAPFRMGKACMQVMAPPIKALNKRVSTLEASFTLPTTVKSPFADLESARIHHSNDAKERIL
jgi:hypothetical protein